MYSFIVHEKALLKIEITRGSICYTKTIILYICEFKEALSSI